MADFLLPLLHYLDVASPTAACTWRGWSIEPITGGANNLLYRATGSDGDYAVKFTVRDARDRAGREFDALQALNDAQLDIAPHPILLDRDSYRQPVVVQSWLAGNVLTDSPQTDDAWAALLDHYCAIHSLTPAATSVILNDAVINESSGAASKAFVQQQAALVPEAEQPQSLRDWLTWFADWTPPTWPTAPRTLCRVDANWRNIIARPGPWASVDWENSGWGDPAFEMADLMTHPAYDGVDAMRWEWLIHEYERRMDDSTAIIRIRTYYTVMLMWWLVRWMRYLYEVPRGLDQRLVARPDGWQARTERKYTEHLARIEEHVAQLP